ncbi:sulfatase-like hydrolase/transferase [Halorientalis marina]|uniref:sulfatase-like hydrolase/transferase n=1 Tax=Halorientalis marina TaxID=2931976 RepID=UPI001FF3AD87|nr:sulfatase-like hydrolase/transferase [Halorientalis marina]
MTQPNIVFLIWDSCDFEAARDHAPTLNSLAESNIWFENAISPSAWSLPTHTSFFNGQYPHEHGTYTGTDTIGETPLGRTLDEKGYRRYGFSANGFASYEYGFDENFDQFLSTRGPMQSTHGVDLHRLSSDGGFSLSELVTETMNAERLTGSLSNLFAGVLSKIGGTHPAFRRIPHSLFQEHGFTYSPELNTRAIEHTIEAEADDETPFFVFANYMDTHYPYVPPKDLQREYCGEAFSLSELKEVHEVCQPLKFKNRAVSNGVNPDLLSAAANLYHAEVRSVDRHLQRIVDTLKRNGAWENTLLVVTADHGEEVATVGSRLESGDPEQISERLYAYDELYRTPLIVAGDWISTATHNDYVSLKNLFDLFANAEEVPDGGTEAVTDLLTPEEEFVAGQYPWIGYDRDTLKEKYPSLSDVVIDRHIVVGYSEQYKLVHTSKGDDWAIKNGNEVSPDDVPMSLYDFCHEQLEAFFDSGKHTELDQGTAEHLEELGYL